MTREGGGKAYNVAVRSDDKSVLQPTLKTDAEEQLQYLDKKCAHGTTIKAIRKYIRQLERELAVVTEAALALGTPSSIEASGLAAEIANAKRFDRAKFRDDCEFADWAQSRARHYLSSPSATSAKLREALEYITNRQCSNPKPVGDSACECCTHHWFHAFGALNPISPPPERKSP